MVYVCEEKKERKRERKRKRNVETYNWLSKNANNKGVNI